MINKDLYPILLNAALCLEISYKYEIICICFETYRQTIML